MLVPFPLAIGVILGLVVGLVSGSWLWGLIVLVVAALAVGAALFFFADHIALRLIGARPLAAGGSQKLRNQLEELCARTGISEPDLYTVGAGSPAIASFGRSEPRLVVTDGLTDALTVVELEAAIARELGKSRAGSTTVDTLAVPFLTLPLAPFAGLRDRLLALFRGGDHDARVDLEGVGITRYPPGLAAALAKMAEGGGRPAGGSAATAHLWAVPEVDGQAAPGTYAFADRVELLAEL